MILILIFAGGKTNIDKFFNSNPGISSRIGNHVDFKDYDVADLTDITKFLLHNDNRFKFTDEALNILVFYISQLINFPAFANARTIKVFLNQLLAYQAVRIENLLLKNGNLNYEDFVTITKDDFLYFTGNDFINIIGSEDIKIYK
jgi:hypothetical protein